MPGIWASAPWLAAKRASMRSPGSSSARAGRRSRRRPALPASGCGPDAIGRRDHERAGGQRVRRDERDAKPCDAPRHHRTAVGEVVAGRAEWSCDHEPVAADAADLVAADRVGRSATRLPGWRWIETSFIATQHARRRGQLDRRGVGASRSRRRGPARTRRRASSRSTAARNPISPKLTPNTGTPVPRTGAGRSGSCRRRRAQSRSPRRPGTAPSAAGFRVRPCFSVSSGSHRNVTPARAGARQQRADRRRGLLGPAVGDHRGETLLAHRLDLSRRRVPGREPAAGLLGQPHERLLVALRPGQPGARIPSSGDPERAPRPTSGSAARRCAGSRTTPPLPTASRPTSNCGLIIARQSRRGAAQPSTAGSTFVSEMNDTSITIMSGDTRDPGLKDARVLALHDRHPRVAAQPQSTRQGDVNRGHVRSPAQQAVGEAAGRGADIERVRAGDIESQRAPARWPA